MSPQSAPGASAMQVRTIAASDEALVPMFMEAMNEGHRFMARLQNEWVSGANRFAHDGECFLGVFQGETPIAIGGLNRDPYDLRRGIGRIRHVYVAAARRRSGVGAKLVRTLSAKAVPTFQVLRLRAASLEAASFYTRLGFTPVTDASATHILRLTDTEE